MFAFAGLSYVGTFFSAMNDLGVATNIIALVFAPVLAILSITSVVAISMEKAIGKWLAIGTFGVAAVYSVVSTIVAFAVIGGSNVTTLLSGIIVMLLAQGLTALYFFVSKRVKETLIK